MTTVAQREADNTSKTPTTPASPAATPASNRPAGDAGDGVPHAAQAVRGSLEAWAAWAQSPTLRLAADDGRPVDWESGRDRESVTRALHRQAQIWRAVLSGEKNRRDLLSADDYLGAADRLLGHLRQLTRRFLRRYWLATTIVVVVLAAVIAAVFAVPTTTVLGVLAVGAGAVGITWRGVASSLGREERRHA